MKRRRVKSVWHIHAFAFAYTSKRTHINDTTIHPYSVQSKTALVFELSLNVACVWLHIHVIIFSHFYAIILCSGRKSNASTPTVKPRLSKNICFYSLTFLVLPRRTCTCRIAFSVHTLIRTHNIENVKRLLLLLLLCACMKRTERERVLSGPS